MSAFRGIHKDGAIATHRFIWQAYPILARRATAAATSLDAFDV